MSRVVRVAAAQSGPFEGRVAAAVVNACATCSTGARAKGRLLVVFTEWR